MKIVEHVRWLQRELPELVGQGVMDGDAAERLRQHYGDPELAAGTAKRWAMVLFGILGAVLIGGGIILLLAHNWEALSRPIRAGISVAPLAITALLGAWLLWTGREGAAWREGVGAAQSLAVGAAIALVAQTYHLGGRFDEFMLTWSLLALPVAYLLRATFPALLCLVGIVVWTAASPGESLCRLWYYPLLCAVLPFLWWTGRGNRYHPRPVLLAWVLAVSLCIGVGFAADHVCWRLDGWPVVFGGVFAVLYLVGARWWGAASAAWQRPFQTVGALGGLGLALILSFEDAWPHLLWYGVDWHGLGRGYFPKAGLEPLIFPLAALVLWGGSWGRRAWREVLFGCLPLLAAAGLILRAFVAAEAAALLFSVYLFFLGLGTLVTGFRSRRLGTVNLGMLVLAATILCRFFDSDLGFVVRGVAFIVIGVGFLMANLVLLRRKGSVGP